MDSGEFRELLGSRYVLISCEGVAERVIASTLIESGRLAVPRDLLIEDPITLAPFTELRSSSDIARKVLSGYDFSLPGGDGLPLVVRIVDKAAKRGVSDRALSRLALPVDVVTRPEIEALVVIKEGKRREWERAKSRDAQLKISDFCKTELGLGDVKKEPFLRAYWSDADELVACIRKYHEWAQRRRVRFLDLSDLLA